MNKQIFFAVEMTRHVAQHGVCQVPVTIDTSQAGYMYDAKKLATMKALDAVRCSISLASEIRWEDGGIDPTLYRIIDVKLIGDPEPPIETYSLVCSNLLALVKSYPATEPWHAIPDTKRDRIVNSMRWLDHNIPNMSDDTLLRLRTVKSFLKQVKAPDELTRDLG